MSETKFTPGPWRVRCNVDRGNDLLGTDQYFYIAAGTEEWHDNKGHFHPDEARYPVDEIEVVGLGFDRDYHTPEGGIRNEADAALISAAPDLYESLEEARELFEMIGKFTGGELTRVTIWREKAEKALKAARGEAS